MIKYYLYSKAGNSFIFVLLLPIIYYILRTPNFDIFLLVGIKPFAGFSAFIQD